MNIHAIKYNEVHKMLSRYMDRRKANRLLPNIVKDVAKSGSFMVNTASLGGAFTWTDTRQGSAYWIALYK